MNAILTLSALLAFAPSALAAGGFTCQTPSSQPGSMAKLSYCVYDPVSDAPAGGWPTIISLPGSGARGPASNAKQLAGYDAVGKLISQYLSGQKDDARTLAATKFLTIVPIAPDGARHFDPDNVLAILNEVKSNYKVDADRVYATGFSMGSRGTFRFATAHPEILAAIAPSAGGAENQGDSTLSQQAAPAVFPLLNKIVNIPMRQFAGSSDTTAGTESPKATEAKLQSLGAKDATLDIMNTDHMGLSTKPWLETDLLSWFLKQSRSGSSSASSSPSASSSSKSGKPTPVAKKPGMVKITRPASNDTSTTDVEDCNEDSSTEDDEEDCEEDETSTSSATADEEDCEEDDDSSNENEEDCEEEDDTAAPSSQPAKSKRSAPVVPAQHRRSIYVSHKRRAVRFGKSMH